MVETLLISGVFSKYKADTKKPIIKWSAFEIGAGKEIRTPDPNLGKVMLYHWAIPASYQQKLMPLELSQRGAYIKSRADNCQATVWGLLFFF